MSNPVNHAVVTGRLAADPTVFTNQKDGSKKVLFTVMAKQARPSAQGERNADAVPVEAFVRGDVQGTGPYENIHKGDLVSVDLWLRQDHYVNRKGVEVYELKANVQDITFLESKTVTSKRLQERVQAAESENQAYKQAPVAQAAPAQDEQLPFQS